MPELPEVENMRMLLTACCNIKIKETVVRNSGLRVKINPSFTEDFSNVFITSIERIGKFLLFNLSNHKCAVIHAGMSGKFIVTNDPTLGKHDHIIWYLENNTLIKYNDPRRFGLALSFNHKIEATASKLFNKISVDALDNTFTPEYLTAKLTKVRSPIKIVLLDQNIVAGIGNIYASEILYCAKVLPTRPANLLNHQEIEKIVKCTKEILKQAITLGGSTLKDYAKPNGDIGGFQNVFKVYGKSTVSCSGCNHSITKIIQGGRATFFCSFEQK